MYSISYQGSHHPWSRETKPAEKYHPEGEAKESARDQATTLWSSHIQLGHSEEQGGLGAQRVLDTQEGDHPH